MTGPSKGNATGRLLSLDAYRGFVMLALASGGLGLARVADRFGEDPIWNAIGYQLEHVSWRGCSSWDLIQPSFMFMVGVAMPYSYASRRERGQSWSRLFAHAVWRSIVLILLGIFLSSAGEPRTNFTFVNVLTQIGLGYTFVFLLLNRPPALQLAAALGILLGYWVLFVMSPLPGPDHHISPEVMFSSLLMKDGSPAHWAPHINIAATFDRWFLNLFPQPGGKPFRFNPGGYTTLNFIPSIATMLFGVLAGELLRSARPARAKLQILVIAGAACLVLGSALDGTICPVVKRIWTPSWAVYSTGWTLFSLAAFYAIIDVAGYRSWAFPMVVVGVNSIAMYVMGQLMKPFVFGSLKTHLGSRPFSGTYGPVVQSVAVLCVLWLICLWMYRRKIFVRL